MLAEATVITVQQKQTLRSRRHLEKF